MPYKFSYSVIIIFLLTVPQVNGQNLLLNGEFDNSLACPSNLGQLELCPGWRIPNASTPDFFRICTDSVSIANAPKNVSGVQDPHSGNGYAGIILFEEGYPDYREYLEGELLNALEKDVIYKIKLQVSWAEHSSYFYDSLGFKFSNERMKGGKGKIKRNNIIKKSSGSVELNFVKLSNRDSWHEVSFMYKAKGGEKFILFGLFGDNITDEKFRNAITTPFGQINRATNKFYLYVDTIVLEEALITIE